MSERFIFNGKRKTVVGIDENGYGPLIGPLIITGIKITTPFDSIYSVSRHILQFSKMIDDSKKVFKRSLKSYQRGESIALSIIYKAGYTPKTFHSLIELISKNTPSHLPDFPLPVWNDKDNFHLLNLLDDAIKLDKIYLEIISAEEFNLLIERFKNKAFIDFLGFKRVREALKAEIFMMGKIGGTKFYTNFFKLTKENTKVLTEEHTISYYKSDDTELYFILNGDEIYLPLMLASIIGKYIRELFMKAICEKFDLFSLIPYASGYKHDKKTYTLLNRIKQNNLTNKFVRIK